VYGTLLEKQQRRRNSQMVSGRAIVHVLYLMSVRLLNFYKVSLRRMQCSCS
jgi:hypothetical protein